MQKSRSGRVRLWWHEIRRHKVLGTVVRDYREVGTDRFDFFYSPGYQCVDCNVTWKR